MSDPPITTARLALYPCSLPLAEALLHDRRQAETLLDAHIPPEWPLPDLRTYLPVYARRLADAPSLLGWGVWLIVHAHHQTLVGDAGFKGQPDSTGMIEIGYSTLPQYRRRGLAFEAVRALVAWAFRQPGVARITADCLPDNQPSIRILEKLGMRCQDRSDHELLSWSLDRG